MIELILELVLDGAIEASGCKKVPWTFRIAVAAVILAFVFGLSALLFITGMKTNSFVLTVLSVVVLIAFVVIVAAKVRKYKNR